MVELVDLLKLGDVTFIEAREPTASEVGAELDHLFVNSLTGVHYTCIDDTPAAQQWLGTDGKTLPTPILATDHPDLVLFYTMDNISGPTLVNETGDTALDGTILGAVQVAGRIGSALYFDGVNDRVDVVDGSQFSLSEFCLSFWINTVDSGGDQQILAADEGNQFVTAERIFQHRVRNGGVFNTVLFDSSQAVIINIDTTGTVTGSRKHVLVNVGSNNLEIFIDGVSDFSSSFSGVVNVNPSQVVVGAMARISSGGGTNYQDLLDGDIDALRFFNRPVTPQEVTALYNEGAP